MRGRTALFVALVALMAPAMATANWTHKGQGELTTNASLGLSGNLTLSTSAGNVVCAAELGTTLTGSGSSGHVSSFTVSKASECDLTGSLAAICGTNGVTKVEKTGTWAMTADETVITISEVDIHYTLGGCLIPGFRVKGSVTATPDKANAISSATLSGNQTLYNALGEEAGSGELKGTLSASPAGTYGVKTAPLVETVWLKHNEHLAEDEELTLSGQFSASGSLGSITCSMVAKAKLLAGEVEEGESEGEVESFTVSSPGACDLTGTLKETCGTNGVEGVEKTGTWDLTATEEDIAVADLDLDFKFKSCAITSLRMAGDATVEVDDPQEIGETTFDGTLDTYNSSEEKIGTAAVSGAQEASPAGTFALTAKPPCGEEIEGEGEGTWTHEGEPLEEATCIELGGPVSFHLFASETGLTGEAKFELLLQPGGVVSVATFDWTKCHGTGMYSSLSCTITPLEQPWAVSLTESGSVEIEAFAATAHFFHPLDSGHTSKLGNLGISGDLTFTPDNPELFSEVELHGFDGTGWEFDGFLGVTPAETYGGI